MIIVYCTRIVIFLYSVNQTVGPDTRRGRGQLFESHYPYSI